MVVLLSIGIPIHISNVKGRVVDFSVSVYWAGKCSCLFPAECSSHLHSLTTINAGDDVFNTCVTVLGTCSLSVVSFYDDNWHAIG